MTAPAYASDQTRTEELIIELAMEASFDCANRRLQHYEATLFAARHDVIMLSAKVNAHLVGAAPRSLRQQLCAAWTRQDDAEDDLIHATAALRRLKQDGRWPD